MTQARTQGIRRRVAILIIAVLIIAGSAVGFILGKRSVGVGITEIVRNVTEGWEVYESKDHGFSFLHPASTEVSYSNGIYTISEKDMPAMIVRVQSTRIISAQDPLAAIQISIPLDKRNFIILSTSSSSDQKEVFYTIASTIKIGR